MIPSQRPNRARCCSSASPWLLSESAACAQRALHKSLQTKLREQLVKRWVIDSAVPARLTLRIITTGEETMPHYEYFCRACQKKFSLVLTLAEHDKEKVKCPKCGSTRVEQQWAAFSAVTSKES